MAPSMLKTNSLLRWALTAKGFQIIKSPTKFPEEPVFSKNGWAV